MKTCSRCQISKSVDEFHRSPKSRDGRNAMCKSCRSAHHSKTYEARKDKIRAANQKNANELRQMIRVAKDRPCQDCGGTYPSYVMDFDHRDPSLKLGDVSQMPTRVSKKRLEEEIAKCDVVCANCHRIRTHAPRG